MSKFVIMEAEGDPPLARIGLVTPVDDAPWMTGSPVSTPTSPIVYEVDRNRPGNLKPIYALSVPIIRDDLLQLLVRQGVDNLQLFDAMIRDGVSSTEHRNYKAFNILGTVSAADMSRSELLHDLSISGVEHDFSKLVLDEARIPSDLLLFRLAESVNAIVVHKRIQEAVEQGGIDDMVFYESGEWAG